MSLNYAAVLPFLPFWHSSGVEGCLSDREKDSAGSTTLPDAGKTVVMLAKEPLFS